MFDAATAPLPPLVFTVAITGHRSIKADHAALHDRIVEVFARCAARLDEQRAANDLDAPRPVTRRFISGMAEGADQIGMRAAQASDGWSCEAILPFGREAFLRTFIDPVLGAATLDALITADTPVLELADWTWTGHADQDPDNEYWRARRYVTLGQMLVRQADLLIAVWNEKPPERRGGTAEVVVEARHAGVPVLWLHADTLAPRSIVPAATGLRNFTIGQPDAGSFPGEEDAIAAAVANCLLGGEAKRAAAVKAFLVDERVPRWQRRGGKQIIGTHSATYSLLLWLSLLGSGLRRWPFVPARRLPDPTWRPGWFARRWRFLVQEIGFFWDTKLGRAPGDSTPDDRPAIVAATAVDAPIAPFMARADAIATRLGHKYRSAYVGIFVLAGVAVALANLGLFVPYGEPWFVLGELGAIGLAIWQWMRLSGQRWLFWRGNNTHQRWLDARLVAESLRSTQFLSWIGFGGRRIVEEMAASDRPAIADDDSEAAAAARAEQAVSQGKPLWSPWVANAVAALTAMPTGEMTPGRIDTLARALGHIIEDQRAYHERNSERLEALHGRLDIFGLTAIAVAALVSLLFVLFSAKLWMSVGAYPMGDEPAAREAHEALHHISKFPAFFGSVGPAAAAALASIRYHGDYERFARRSEETTAALNQLGLRAEELAQRAGACSGAICDGSPPIFEDLLELMLDTQAVLDDDLLDWRFAYAARPMPLP
ncbi:hypothetical protein QH494_23975 [Sphingomonas sp. AR_OL41]|uniref:hypothetical protein n=1 Tax=Sphingomonas sp. AR_OL41 TaxID=3042729 RepID=UPI002480365B|nr:hypothetical protein [Sphingomonas sp. AR_OL41]MDH7975255.1 hypothetical protein [Sphingomonas sp. AR_OL41]